MKNLFLVIAICFLTCGCSAPKMTNSVWCAMEALQNADQDGLGVTSLYMYDDGNLDVYKSVVVESGMVVAPYLYAKGSYKIAGNLKKEGAISITATDLHKKPIGYHGIIDLKKESMLLMAPDSTTIFFVKYGNLAID